MRGTVFKCIGAILVLYTGAAMGWRKGNAAMRRVQVLADICAFLAAQCGTTFIFAAAERRKSSLRHSENTRLSALPLYFSDSRLRLRPSDRAGQCALPH